MPDRPIKFRNKYRIPSARLPGQDYAATGRYFVTICTKYREHTFGEIKNGIMRLSDAGCIAWRCWEQIPMHYPWVSLGAFIVMPNHVHGIIKIGPRDNCDEPNRVETGHAPSLQHTTHKTGFELPSGSLGAIVNQFKSACTKHIRKSTPNHFAWQSRFHDHVIRNDIEYDRIEAYIVANPIRWEQDKFFIGMG